MSDPESKEQYAKVSRDYYKNNKKLRDRIGEDGYAEYDDIEQGARDLHYKTAIGFEKYQNKQREKFIAQEKDSAFVDDPSHNS